MKNKLKVEKYLNNSNNILNIFQEDFDFDNFIKIKNKNKSYKKIHNSTDKIESKARKNYHNRIIDIDED
jgi:hypothetical protein